MLCCAVLNLSHVWHFATSWTVTWQAPLSMEFSRPEYWSGLPCPPPRNLPNPRIKPRSPTFQVDSLPSEAPGKPKNTGVGSLSLLQRTFLTQESNQGLWHCRRILYQLSYQGSNERSQRIYIKVLTAVSAWRDYIFCSLVSRMWMIMMWISIYLVIEK